MVARSVCLFGYLRASYTLVYAYQNLQYYFSLRSVFSLFLLYFPGNLCIINLVAIVDMKILIGIHMISLLISIYFMQVCDAIKPLVHIPFCCCYFWLSQIGELEWEADDDEYSSAEWQDTKVTKRSRLECDFFWLIKYKHKKISYLVKTRMSVILCQCWLLWYALK